ncbi:GNAT family N-acetyltransferase [Croceicoccus sp. F390]|uniref:GNAT family N-acetyltransferase n=1 Tax=Croceicoccus esteveae TaxID=3075597 RepID=A0ABU2ZJM9_9SPHN|nr:GNAT family N-acetyltransferase [Croceicoccus sp. F390]MDT0576514.1 GNAT family N-acetyltransferase [Croceicoccus sp. F390]
MPQGRSVRIAPDVSSLPAGQWDALDATGNPFTSHRFLSLLEEAGSVGGRSGWKPAPLVMEGQDTSLSAAVPLYIKGHSQGEYVFDHGWAEAWHRAGGSYYPKLQIAVPFTPATGPRILARNRDDAAAMIQAIEMLCDQHGMSSAHATFVEQDQLPLFRDAGWLIRQDVQFHWQNRNYADFEAFLDSLSSRKRKAIRKERARATQGLQMLDLTGSEVRPDHWDAFWQFYQDTGARKWGQPYLTRATFDLIGERMADEVLLMLAMDNGTPVAGALNFIGPQALYGRYWGTLVDRPFLHFELCYYRAIDAAIERGLVRVEAGAQGAHKLARGYEPVHTFSAHYITDEGFRAAVADFVKREAEQVGADRDMLAAMVPFRKAE